MTSAHHHPNADVRMRGFRSRSSVSQVWEWIAQLPPSSRCETIPLEQATGRVLAAALVSQTDVPQFARAMMDGYALQAESTAGASLYQNLLITVIGESLPAHPFSGSVRPGTAVRIMTGAPLPEGADSVIPAEATETRGQQIMVTSEVTPRKHVGEVGEDLRAGQLALPAGRRLRPQDLGLLASIGLQQVTVTAVPRVVIVITGNEVVAPGAAPARYQIIDANGPMLQSLAMRDGAAGPQRIYVPDDPDQLTQALQLEADVVLVSGGSSVGSEDHAPRLVDQLGELVFHGLAMRPSSPTGMGKIGSRLVFLLPGNPVSCLAAYDFFAGRAIRQLSGDLRAWTYRSQQLNLARKITSPLGRTDYARVRVRDSMVEPLAISGASILSSTTQADGFVIVPEASEGYAAGEPLLVYFYD